jgi:NAD+ kinase
MRIGIHGRDFQQKSHQFIDHILDHLLRQRIQVWVSDKLYKLLARSYQRKVKSFQLGDSLRGLHAFLSIGGDGTMLESVTYMGKTQVPTLGINTGRLGFLATVNREDAFTAIDDVVKGNFTTEDRTLLALKSSTGLFGDFNFALNDLTIMKKDSSSMIHVDVFVNKQLLNSYWADGIIVATPTGSTGYSLSCGGPLVHPASKSFVITPVSPHTLTARPVVVNDESEISFRIEGRTNRFLLSLDSRFESIDSTVKLSVKKARFSTKLIHLPHYQYFLTLQRKLNWGLDARN